MDCQAAKSSVSPLQLRDSYLVDLPLLSHSYSDRLQVSILIMLERLSIGTFVIKELLAVMARCPC